MKIAAEHESYVQLILKPVLNFAAFRIGSKDFIF